MSDTAAGSGGQLRQICFMIMPYGRKPTGAEPGKGPATVDFDALWEKVFRPVIEEDLNCEPVRADQDWGALIIVEMIERLALSDLVIADVTTPNANVYYEVGVRHAARDRGCVLVSADWSRQKFDLDQMRQLRYPLPEGAITDETAAAARATLRERIREATEGISPVHQTLPGYPALDPAHAKSFRAHVEAISAFNTEVRAARLQPGADVARAARTLWERYRGNVGRMSSVTLPVLYLLRDAGDWQGVRELVEGLPHAVRSLPVVQEQYWLARAKQGDPEDAIAALEELIRVTGDSSERRGLIGGRYKKLYDGAPAGSAEKTRYLAQAIDQYERGMLLDLNDYYPASNLPRLLRLRGRPGDEDHARAAATVTMLACRRALARNPDDEWVRPTLLGAAFGAGDVTEATRLYDEMLRNGIAAFHLETTLADLDRTVAGMREGETRAQLAALLGELRALLPAPAGGGA